MEILQVQHQAQDTKARTGILTTDHGVVETPVFMPVGTQGTVKAVEPRQLHELGYRIILGNTYHLYLRPGEQVLQDFGGLHRFMQWNGAILTDSGGFQIFSLQDLRSVSEDGVEFRSHIDGSKHFFTPEKVIDIQRSIGSDIMMVLDECPPYPTSYREMQRAVERTIQWAKRCRQQWQTQPPLYEWRQWLFAIGQGGVYRDLRQQCLEALIAMDFSGYAIGGLAVGEPIEQMLEVVDWSTDWIPVTKPRYLMGVGTPVDILEAIDRGVDMFDCVLPTRNARNGQLFTTRGKLNIRNAKFRGSREPIDPGLPYYISQEFTLGYLHHLFRAKEILGLQLATLQNLAFYQWLVQTARQKIRQNRFRQWKESFIQQWTATGRVAT